MFKNFSLSNYTPTNKKINGNTVKCQVYDLVKIVLKIAVVFYIP